MIPRGEQWEEIAGLEGGDLAVTSYAVVLAAMARSGRTGVLRVVKADPGGYAEAPHGVDGYEQQGRRERIAERAVAHKQAGYFFADLFVDCRHWWCTWCTRPG